MQKTTRLRHVANSPEDALRADPNDYIVRTGLAVYWPYRDHTQFWSLCRSARHYGGVWTGRQRVFPDLASSQRMVDRAIKLGYCEIRGASECTVTPLRDGTTAIISPIIPALMDLGDCRTAIVGDVGVMVTRVRSKRDLKDATEHVASLLIPISETAPRGSDAADVRICNSRYVSVLSVPVKQDPVSMLLFPAHADGVAYRVNANGRAEMRIYRGDWPTIRSAMGALGLRADGDDPTYAADPTPTKNQSICVPGWSAPTADGSMLYAYQRDAVAYAAARGYRCIIADEMGVGKTPEAIAAACHSEAKRILIVAPANVRYVWSSEIEKWTGAPYQHMSKSNDPITIGDGWLIVSYGLLSGWGPKKRKKGAPPQKRRRRCNQIVERIREWGPDMIIPDEVHRAKNADAKCTRALRALCAADETHVIALTGTPIRNRVDELSQIVELVDPEMAEYCRQSDMSALARIAPTIALRRLKADVLPELPPVTRQSRPVDVAAEATEKYALSVRDARQKYDAVFAETLDPKRAAAAAIGMIERARIALGLGKIDAVAELVVQILDAPPGCCIVYTAHHDVTDALAKKLREKRIGIIDGRVPPKERAHLIAAFQAAKLDVLVCGIGAASEGITLTRADTVVFAELDWVPAAMRQAEARIHRVGQLAAKCWTYHVVVSAESLPDNIDIAMADAVLRKNQLANDVFSENLEVLDPTQHDATRNGIIRRVLDRLHESP